MWSLSHSLLLCMIKDLIEWISLLSLSPSPLLPATDPQGLELLLHHRRCRRDEEKNCRHGQDFSHYLFKLNAIVDVESGHWCGVN